MIPLQIRQVGNAALLLREAIGLSPLAHDRGTELQRRALSLLEASLASQGYTLHDFDGSDENDEGL